jgi:lysophospholipase L1-like esterase
MRKRSILSVVAAAAVTTSLAAVGLVATPGIGQAAAKHTKPALPFYVSLGDSYSIGYQPTAPGGGGTPGYTAYVAKKEKLTLENFGCGGATTSSILNTIGCGDPAATSAVAYPTETQAQAALDFIAANPGKVGLVTVSIGGNDVTACAGAGTTAAILSCITAADNSITTNVGSLVSQLDAALTTAGDTAKVVGLTYPDVILGDWVFPSGSPDQSLATLSTTAFDNLINPTLSAAYGSANFVNVTQAPYKKATSGDDTTTGKPVTLAPYGAIPRNVWEICTLTYFCSSGNIHANDAGYEFIGKLIVSHLAA